MAKAGSDRVAVGIIGAGFIGGVHAGILSKDPRVNIAVIHDADSGRASALAALYGATAAASLEDVWRNCDAVYICAPNVRHAELALAAIAAGKHVMCEKPMTTTLADAKRVAEAAAASRTVFQVGQNRRFAPSYAVVRSAIRGDVQPLAAQIKMNRGELEVPPWTADASVTGGFLFETPVHVIDLGNYLFGPLATVYARATRKIYPQEDSFAAVLSYRSGIDATLTTCAFTGWLFPFEQVEIYGKHATIRTMEMERVEISKGLGAVTTEHSFVQLPRDERWGYVEEDRLFVDAVTQNKPPLVTAEDGFRTVEAIDAIYRSAREGCAVNLE